MSREIEGTLAKRRRVIVVGGGFAGVAAVRALRRSDVDVILVDRRNHHLFQPLLYQVATAVLAPAEIASPLRQLVSEQANVEVRLAEVTHIDVASNAIEIAPPGLPTERLVFDFLIVATGAFPTYFGHDGFAAFAPALKTLSDAERIRARILAAYELAEQAADPVVRARALTFVLIGAGPTGVELAASIATMARTTLRSNFRHIRPDETRTVLVEGGARILPAFDPSLARRVAARLETLGVTIRTGVMVEQVDAHGVVIAGERIESATVLWTAGVAVSALVRLLGAPVDRAGRAQVDAFLAVPGRPHVFVVGDAAAIVQDGHALPGVAQVAIQEGRHAGDCIARLLRGLAPRPFRYFDRGNMAVVGRNYAVLERGHVRSAGFLTWVLWACVHVLFLPQLQNRLRVQIQWFWSYFTGQRASRLIPEETVQPDAKRNA